MSGHSKWSQIKRQKGVADSKRSAAFGKLGSAITVAARAGADPEMNFQLRIAVDKARAANMPKDNIERAIERAKGVGANALEEIIFEAYGPGGTAFIIESATDNRNRTIGEIRAALNKYDGKLAESGAVGYLFKKLGLIIAPAGAEPETTELSAIEAGAADVDIQDDQVYVTTEPTELETVRRNLAQAGIESNEISFEWQPTASITLDQTATEKAMKLYEALDSIEDVTKVSSNFEIG